MEITLENIITIIILKTIMIIITEKVEVGADLETDNKMESLKEISLIISIIAIWIKEIKMIELLGNHLIYIILE